MLQFNNEPLVLTHIHLSYLTLEERITFMMFPEEDLLKEGPWKLTPQDIPKFRQTIQLSLEKDYQKLIDNKVRTIRQSGDDAALILARTIEEQQREIAALLQLRYDVTEARKMELRDLNPEDSIENMIKRDSLLNTINMELVEHQLGENAVEIGLSGITRFPEALVVRLQEYPKLTELYISTSALTTLPESFGNLTTLTSLYLCNNLLQTLPESFGNLTALTGLHLYNNHLQTLPESLGNLMALKTLELYQNNLKSLPESLGNLKALEVLYLEQNPLQTLPESLRGILSQKRNTDLLCLLAPEQPLIPQIQEKMEVQLTTLKQAKPKHKPMLLAPCPASSRRRMLQFKKKKTQKTEKRKSAPGSLWLELQAMVKEVDAHQGLLVPSEQMSDAASIAALDAVRDFLNNPENINDFDGLRAFLTDAPDEQMGMGMAVKQFKEVPVSKLYDNLFKALQNAPQEEPQGKIRKIM